MMSVAGPFPGGSLPVGGTGAKRRWGAPMIATKIRGAEVPELLVEIDAWAPLDVALRGFSAA